MRRRLYSKRKVKEYFYSTTLFKSMFPFNWIVCREIFRSTAGFPDYDSIYIHYFKSIFPFNCSVSRIYFHSIVGFPDNFPFIVRFQRIYHSIVRFPEIFPFNCIVSRVCFHSFFLNLSYISTQLHSLRSVFPFYFHLPAVYPEYVFINCKFFFNFTCSF